MLFWRKPALTPTNNYENKTVCVFFQGASDATAKILRRPKRCTTITQGKNWPTTLFWLLSLCLSFRTDLTKRTLLHAKYFFHTEAALTQFKMKLDGWDP